MITGEGDLLDADLVRVVDGAADAAARGDDPYVANGVTIRSAINLLSCADARTNDEDRCCAENGRNPHAAIRQTLRARSQPPRTALGAMSVKAVTWVQTAP